MKQNDLEKVRRFWKRPPGHHLLGFLRGGSDFLASFNGFGLTAAGQSIFGVNLNCFPLDWMFLRTLDLNDVFQGSVIWSFSG